jgi:hypothetical protein
MNTECLRDTLDCRQLERVSICLDRESPPCPYRKSPAFIKLNSTQQPRKRICIPLMVHTAMRALLSRQADAKTLLRSLLRFQPVAFKRVRKRRPCRICGKPATEHRLE